MEWSTLPPKSLSPDSANILGSIAMQPSSTTSSVVDSASITNNSISATSISTTPERTSAAAEEDSEKEKNEGVKLVEEEIEDVTGKENRYETVEEGEGAQKGEGMENLSENEDEKDQTRNTRKLRDRARQSPTTPSNTKTTKKVKEIKTITRQLRSTAKKPSSASAKKFADKTRRQSKRLSIIATSKLLETTTPSAPRGKRSHDVMAAGSKSANAKLQGNGSHYAADGSLLRASKRSKKNLSYNEDTDDESSIARETSEELPANSQAKKPQKKKKVWLNQGLYLGQGQDLDVRKRPGGKAKKRGKSSADRQAVLPLPMFTGSVIMDTVRDFKLPFNIFAPSPWKCGPIHNWKKLNHNVLIGEASQLWKREKASMAMCVCEEEKGCDEDCLNRCTWVECDEGNCNVPNNCSNRAFADLKERVKQGTKFAEGVETRNCGHGLRATRSFAPRQIVVEYTGEIITQEESERRMIEDYKDNNNYYLMLFHQNMILDATRGSVARFVNHSCNPNCRMEKWLVDGKPRMALFAGDYGIEAGDELTYDYNFNWFTGVSQQACHCGAENCRGALGKRADGLQKKPEPPAKGKNGKGKKKGINGKGGIVAEVKKPTRGRPKKVVAHVQKSVIITPKRKYTKRKVVAAPVISPSPAPEDDDSLDSSLDSDDDSDHPTEASPATLKKSSLSEAARRRRNYNKAGRPRVTKTYKVNKTIRGGKGKIIHKSVTSKKAVSALKKKAFETVLTTTSTTTTVKTKTSGPLSSASSVTSASTGTVMTRATRRSLGVTRAVDDKVAHQLLEQAINTVLSSASVGVEEIPEGVIGTVAPALSAVQVAG
ncbi:uncharacterized protein H6S33_002470 [Morchella sextelata]|uniref:uncharacterized protein n=1 Tax=Morchella sextelata TaxID=1174677 RepID=UPI001D04E556|nr:uncharacterized protein H6S33_002470 [Morchella sextelata]KAH0607436.1 hypothetical protein H6S33_002470 [Morchella sextelata]